MSQAADLFAAGSLVLHAPTGIVGRVKTVWEAGEYVAPMLAEAGVVLPDAPAPAPVAVERCKYPVVELSTGDRFLLRPDEPGALRSLTEAEARCYAEVLLPFMLAAARSARTITANSPQAEEFGTGVGRPLVSAAAIGALFMAAARAALIEAGIKLPGAEP